MGHSSMSNFGIFVSIQLVLAVPFMEIKDPSVPSTSVVLGRDDAIYNEEYAQREKKKKKKENNEKNSH